MKRQRQRSVVEVALASVAALTLAAAVLAAAGGASDESGHSSDSPARFEWQLPHGFPEPWVPADNPMTEAKVTLGRALFYDPRLSIDGEMSCATCHQQERAFTDGRARAVGATGEIHPRSSMSLANVGYNLTLTWADPRLERLEEQLLTPLFGHEPVEMGLRHSRPLLDTLAADWWTALLFREAFPGEKEPVTLDNLAKAIAAFERTLISGDSPFDRFFYQDQSDALSPAAQRGMRLFFSRRLGCAECHGRFTFSGPIRHVGSKNLAKIFHNTGLYNLDGDGAYPDSGIQRWTREPGDMGHFRAPTLRNIARTAPYMHDGSISTLEEVIGHYAAGGRRIDKGAYAGDGRASPLKSELLSGFEINAQDRAALLAFLDSLTDETFLQDPRFADPRSPSASVTHF